MAMSNIDHVTSLHKNNELQLFCFSLDKGGDLYAVNVFKVREVVRYDGPLTVVSHSDSSLVEGLIIIRDLTIPLVDIKKWFHYDPKHPDRDIRDFVVKRNNLNDYDVVMVCEFSNWIIAVRIFGADRILSKKWVEIEQASGMGSNASQGKLVSRTRYYDGRLVQIVDIERMLTDVFPWIEEEKSGDMGNVKKIDTTRLILLADDSPSALRTAKGMLERLGVGHRDFTTGQDLLDFVMNESTDLSTIGAIITDIEMPGASGFEVIKQVKQDPRTRGIPVIVNSSMSSDSNEAMAMSLGADSFVSKSDFVEIENAIRKHMLT